MIGCAGDVLAQGQRQPGSAAGVDAGFQQLAQIDRGAPLVGQLDADHVAAGDHGHAHRQRAQRAGDVVGEADHPGGTGAGRRLQLVERHDRPGLGVDDLAADAEIVEHGLQLARVLGQRSATAPAMAHAPWAGASRSSARQLEAGLGDAVGGRRASGWRLRRAGAGRRWRRARVARLGAGSGSTRRGLGGGGPAAPAVVLAVERLPGRLAASRPRRPPRRVGRRRPGRRGAAAGQPSRASRRARRPEREVAAPAASPSRRPTQSEPAGDAAGGPDPLGPAQPSAVKPSSRASTRLPPAKAVRTEQRARASAMQSRRRPRPARPAAARSRSAAAAATPGRRRGRAAPAAGSARHPGPGQRPAEGQPQAPARPTSTGSQAAKPNSW